MKNAAGKYGCGKKRNKIRIEGKISEKYPNLSLKAVSVFPANPAAVSLRQTVLSFR